MNQLAAPNEGPTTCEPATAAIALFFLGRMTNRRLAQAY